MRLSFLERERTVASRGYNLVSGELDRAVRRHLQTPQPEG